MAADRVPNDLETFRATLDAAGFPVGSERVSVFWHLPEHIKARVFSGPVARGEAMAESVCESDLSPAARHVALTVALVHGVDDRPLPPLPTLARQTGRSSQTVKRALLELVREGFLSRERL